MVKESHVIDKCEVCGFISYSVITRCPLCGNMILTGEIIDKSSWVRGRAKELLNERERKNS